MKRISKTSYPILSRNETTVLRLYDNPQVARSPPVKEN
jgi:hypothetical protein